MTCGQQADLTSASAAWGSVADGVKLGEHPLERLDAGAQLRAQVGGQPVPVEASRDDTFGRKHVEGDGDLAQREPGLLWPFTAPERADELAPPVVQRLARTGRVVYLSAEASIHAPDRFWGRVQRVVERTAPGWTVLLPTGFASNTRMWADQIRAGDVLRWPFAKARRSLIHERDIAAVAARALLHGGHDHGNYVITGPQAISQEDQLEAIGVALGRQLRWTELDRDAALALLAGRFGNERFARGALETWAGFADQPETVNSEVQRILGRPALSFARWAADHADDFL